jgi:hypothetical protein
LARIYGKNYRERTVEEKFWNTPTIPSPADHAEITFYISFKIPTEIGIILALFETQLTC